MPRLLAQVLNALPVATRDQIVRDVRFLGMQKKNDFPKCFSIIQSVIGRKALELEVRQELRRYTVPGEVLKQLAGWPFAGYVTTNYDSLIQVALRNMGQWGGWSEAGNSLQKLENCQVTHGNLPVIMGQTAAFIGK